MRALPDPAWASPPGAVPGFTAGFHSNPVGKGLALPRFPGQESLDPESLVRRLGKRESAPCAVVAERERAQLKFYIL